MKSKKMMLFRNAIILILSLIFLVGGGICIYANQLLDKIDYTPDSGSKVSTGSLFENGNASSGAVSAKSGVIGGLYHDDAITNILLLGCDDYQKNDSGRSDSMMLVSVDTRHKKLKITSLMRDMYIAVPGSGNDKLNGVYGHVGGGGKGARKILSTLEANFGVDIDRFVIIDFSAFPKIIDRLGGVPVTLTEKEAGLVNAYSGDSKQVHAGVNNMDGLQARYYSRIRAIGNDQARTERQRKVFSSIVDKMKKASLPQIYSVFAYILPLVTTNMTKNEVVSLASNSLTYLHYPLKQYRVPEEGEYRDSNKNEIFIDGEPADVLILDLNKCRKSFTSFIFENDIPTGKYSG